MAEPTMQSRGGGNAGGGEGGGMRTVDCLRGRLLAERVASKAAKEEADQLAHRLDELEKLLSDEVKMRSKAEKRLRRAVKKLESLKTLGAGLSESSTGSLPSNGCVGHHQTPEMVGERNSPPGSLSTVDSGPLVGGDGTKGWDGDSTPDSSAGSCTQVNSSQDGSWFSVVSEQSGSGSGPCKEESPMAIDPDDTKNCVYAEDGDGVDHDSSSEREREQQPVASNGSSKSSETERDEDADRLALVLVDDPHHGAEAGGPRSEDDGDTRASGEEEDNRLAIVLADPAAGEEEDNRLAIVLADPEPPRQPAEERGGGHRSGSTDVESVLLALRQVKEQLRYTIERRSPGLVAHRELCGH